MKLAPVSISSEPSPGSKDERERVGGGQRWLRGGERVARDDRRRKLRRIERSGENRRRRRERERERVWVGRASPCGRPLLGAF